MVQFTEPPIDPPIGAHVVVEENVLQFKPNGKGAIAPLLRPYVARPFSEIPMRQWLHAKHYIRQHVVMTVAPGGWGKTSLVLLNAIEMATGRGLIGPPPPMRLRVAVWNGEDPDEENDRRIAAICIHHDVDPHELEGYLFLGSKVTRERRIAMMDRSQNVLLNKLMLDEVSMFIEANAIDCAIFDPFLAFHCIPEGNNNLMEEMISSAFTPITSHCNCCVELAQHTRKSSNAISGELSVEDSRGGGAITNAARSVRVLNRMTPAEAKEVGIEEDERRHYVRVTRDKSNMAPPGKATWLHLVGVSLPNGVDGGPGDNVQAGEHWHYPEPLDNVSAADMHWMREEVKREDYRKDSRSPKWVGKPLADHLMLDLDVPADRSKVNFILRKWFENGALDIAKREDEKRREREFVVPGHWKDEDAPVADF